MITQQTVNTYYVGQKAFMQVYNETYEVLVDKVFIKYVWVHDAHGDIYKFKEVNNCKALEDKNYFRLYRSEKEFKDHLAFYAKKGDKSASIG